MIESVCPHCGDPLQRFSLPDNTGWEGDFQLACFNDECPYYQRGWRHMEEHYAAKASYRYRVDPATGPPPPWPSGHRPRSRTGSSTHCRSIRPAIGGAREE